MCCISSSVGYLSLKFGNSLHLRFHLFVVSSFRRASSPSTAVGRAVFFFFGINTTVGTVIEEGAAGQRIPTVEGMQRLANRPRGRITFSTNRLVSVANEPSSGAESPERKPSWRSRKYINGTIGQRRNAQHS